MLEGPLAALDAIEQATGEREVNVDRLLPRRHAAGGHAGLHGGEAATADQGRDLLRHPGRLRGRRRARRVHRRGAARRPRGAAWSERGYLEGARDGDDLQHAARQRPDLVVRGQQLPARQGAVPLRPALLERGLRRACRRPCTASTCATCTRRTCCRAGRHQPARRADRPRARSRCRSTCCRPGRTTSRPGDRPTRRPSSIAGPATSCSRARATSPA